MYSLGINISFLSHLWILLLCFAISCYFCYIQFSSFNFGRCHCDHKITSHYHSICLMSLIEFKIPILCVIFDKKIVKVKWELLIDILGKKWRKLVKLGCFAWRTAMEFFTMSKFYAGYLNINFGINLRLLQKVFMNLNNTYQQCFDNSWFLNWILWLYLNHSCAFIIALEWFIRTFEIFESVWSFRWKFFFKIVAWSVVFAVKTSKRSFFSFEV